jgi:hypothetical protein
MKFISFFSPDSMELLNFRIKIRSQACPHCGCSQSITAHGYLRGLAECGNEIVSRGLRFFVQIVTQI